MLQKIKELADKAIAVQNKDAMNAALREISAMTEKLSVNEQDQRDAPFKPLWPTMPDVILDKYHAAVESQIKKGGANE